MAYNQSRQDSSGTLKTTISLGRTPAIVHSGPFYLMKEPPEASELTGSTNLIAHHRLSNTYLKLLNKKKNELSSFVNHFTDNKSNLPLAQQNLVDINCTLQSLLNERIISGKEILPMTATQLIGFRLHPGQLPAQYRLFSQIIHKKHKKHKKKQKNQTHDSHNQGDGSGPSDIVDPALVERKKKEKKKEKKKDKKDKKDKKRKTHGQASGEDM